MRRLQAVRFARRSSASFLPDNRLDAILFESNGGATTSFGYEVIIGRKGSREGAKIAKLYGAVRNSQAYGVDIRWNSNNELVIEYLNVKSPPEIQEAIDVDGRHIHVLVRSGVTNLNAPSGGMLYNLKRR